MKTLNAIELDQVAGGYRRSKVVKVIKEVYQEIASAAFWDMVTGAMEDLGEQENRPTGTRP